MDVTNFNVFGIIRGEDWRFVSDQIWEVLDISTLNTNLKIQYHKLTCNFKEILVILYD